MKPILLPIAALSVAVASFTAHAEPEITGKPSELSAFLDKSKPVDLTGEAEVKIPVDRALVTVRATTENKSLAEAIGANRALRARFIDTLAAKGIPADRVTPSRFSSTPSYRVLSEKVKSYKVENLVQVSVKDETEFQHVIAAADSLVDIQFSSIESAPSDLEKIRRDAFTKAMADAEQKRKLIEEKLGLKLEAKAIDESPESDLHRAALGNQRAYAPLAAKVGSFDSSYSQAPAAGGEAPGGLGEIVVRAKVRVTYVSAAK